MKKIIDKKLLKTVLIREFYFYTSLLLFFITIQYFYPSTLKIIEDLFDQDIESMVSLFIFALVTILLAFLLTYRKPNLFGENEPLSRYSAAMSFFPLYFIYNILVELTFLSTTIFNPIQFKYHIESFSKILICLFLLTLSFLIIYIQELRVKHENKKTLTLNLKKLKFEYEIELKKMDIKNLLLIKELLETESK